MRWLFYMGGGNRHTCILVYGIYGCISGEFVAWTMKTIKVVCDHSTKREVLWKFYG